MGRVILRMPLFTKARGVVGVAIAGAIAFAIVFFGASPASASVSKYHGMWSSQVSGCSSNFRVGKTARLVTDTGADYGWVEWRASHTGHCAGYQWVRFHFSRSLGYTADESNYKMMAMVYQKDQWGRMVETWWKYNQVALKKRMLKAGAYNSRIFYAPNEKACAEFDTYYSTNNTHFLTIKGSGGLGHLTFCA